MVSSGRGSGHDPLLNSNRGSIQGVVVQTRDGSTRRHLHINGTTFKIPERYNHLEVVGKGSYGVVCGAVDSIRKNAAVAIKKISPMAAHSSDAKHVLREVRVMRHLGQHENIITLEDLFCNEAEDELYIVMERLESDLHRVIQSKQVLSMKHHRVFMIQILRGLDFLHKNGIIHRDLKPGNILLTRNCELRISDFGLARELPKTAKAAAEARQDGEGMTEHVVTRWYRPPELMLSPNGFYGLPVDLWSVGCIFGELLGRRPLFPGTSFVDQLSLIFDVLGAPAPEEVAYIRGAQARKFLDKLGNKPGVAFSDLLPGAPPDATALLKSLLLFDPLKRCTTAEALHHPFFDDLRDDVVPDVPPPTELDFDFEQRGVTRTRLKELIAAEIDHFQSGGANLSLKPKATSVQKQQHRQQQQQHRQQQQQGLDQSLCPGRSHAVGPSSDDEEASRDSSVKPTASASATVPATAMSIATSTAAGATIAAVAAAAASSAPFSSDEEGDDDDDDDSDDFDDEFDYDFEDHSTDSEESLGYINSDVAKETHVGDPRKRKGTPLPTGRTLAEIEDADEEDRNETVVQEESGDDDDGDGCGGGGGGTLDDSSDDGEDGGGTNISCVDVVSLQSSRLRAKEERRQGGGSDDSSTADGQDSGEDSPREGELVEVVVTMGGADDEGTLPPLSSGPSLWSPDKNEHRNNTRGGGITVGGNGMHGNRCITTYREHRQMKKKEAAERTQHGVEGRLGRAALTMGAATATATATAKTIGRGPLGNLYISPMRVRGTRDRNDCPPIPEEEDSPEATTNRQTGRGHNNDFGAGSVVPGKCVMGSQTGAFPRFDSTVEISPCEALKPMQSTVPFPASVMPEKLAARTSVAGFVRGSDGWDEEAVAGKNKEGASFGNDRVSLAVGLHSPPSLWASASFDVQRYKRGSNDGGDESESRERGDKEEAENYELVHGEEFHRSNRMGAMTFAPVAPRLERGEQAWRRAVGARAHTVDVAATAAAATGLSGQATNGGHAAHPAAAVAAEEQEAIRSAVAAPGAMSPIFERNSRSRVGVAYDGSRSGVRAMPQEAAHRPSSSPPQTTDSSRQASVAGSIALLATDNMAWLRGESYTSKPTANEYRLGDAAEGVKHAPRKGCESREVLNDDPFCDFVSCKPSSATHSSDLFCDSTGARAAISPRAVRAPAARARRSSGISPPDGVDGQFPFMSVRQTRRGRVAAEAPAAQKWNAEFQQPLEEGDTNKLDSRLLPPRAPVGSIQQEHLMPVLLPPRHFDFPKTVSRVSSVVSSVGSPPPVPPPLGQRCADSARAASSRRCNPSNHARAGGQGEVRPHVDPAAVVVVDTGAGRGRQRVLLPPPIATAMRIKAEGRGGGLAIKREHPSSAAPVVPAAMQGEPQASPTQEPGDAQTVSTSHETYYSADDVVILELPDRFLCSSASGNGDASNGSDETRTGDGDGAPPSPAYHKQLTTNACGRPQCLAPPMKAWNRTGERVMPTAAACDPEKASGGDSQHPRLSDYRTITASTTSAEDPPPQQVAIEGAVVAATAAPFVTTAANGGGGGSSTSAAAAVTVRGRDEASHRNVSIASAMFSALKSDMNDLCRSNEGGRKVDEEGFEDVNRGGVGMTQGSGDVKEKPKPNLPPASADQKFTLLRRLWKRSSDARKMGRQDCGAISSARRTAGPARATSFDAEPSPEKERPARQPRSQSAKAWGARNSSRVVSGERRDDGDADLPPRPVFVQATAAASSFLAQQQMSLKERERPQASFADRSHERTVSNATNLTCGTSPASSATSGCRDGSQALLLVHNTHESGLSPTGHRRGCGTNFGFGSGPVGPGVVTPHSSVITSEATETSVAGLRSGWGRRLPRDKMIRAVQFVDADADDDEEEEEESPTASHDLERRRQADVSIEGCMYTYTGRDTRCE